MIETTTTRELTQIVGKTPTTVSLRIFSLGEDHDPIEVPKLVLPANLRGASVGNYLMVWVTVDALGGVQLRDYHRAPPPIKEEELDGPRV
jgi:hypothetical protein